MKNLNQQYQSYVEEVKLTPGKHWVSYSTFSKMHRDEFNKNVILPESRHFDFSLEDKKLSSDVRIWVNERLARSHCGNSCSYLYEKYLEEMREDKKKPCSKTIFGKAVTSNFGGSKIITLSNGLRARGYYIDIKNKE